jgi:transcriptional regulator with XRE-family HTH domain
MRLGELIAVARECKGWTLRDLERKSGISNALISQIETNKVKDPGFSTVVALMDALGLKLDRAAEGIRARLDVLRTHVVGRSSGEMREGCQVAGMPNAICHACGLGYKCDDADCPNDLPNPMMVAGT